MHWLILCNECADNIDPDDIGGVFEAKYGFQGEGEDGAVLVCQDWDLPHIPDAQQYFCDGEECGKAIAVAPSSLWFINNHREEREERERA